MPAYSFQDPPTIIVGGFPFYAQKKKRCHSELVSESLYMSF